MTGKNDNYFKAKTTDSLFVAPTYCIVWRRLVAPLLGLIYLLGSSIRDAVGEMIGFSIVHI
jgi:hypothetical protein